MLVAAGGSQRSPVVELRPALEMVMNHSISTESSELISMFVYDLNLTVSAIRFLIASHIAENYAPRTWKRDLTEKDRNSSTVSTRNIWSHVVIYRTAP